jgi:hypothetical protein
MCRAIQRILFILDDPIESGEDPGGTTLQSWDDGYMAVQPSLCFVYLSSIIRASLYRVRILVLLELAVVLKELVADNVC